MINLRNINLNLLVSLDFLLKEKNVTRAAKKACLSQAAMSANLKNLRKIFKNELLIREKNRFSLTPYALELQPQLHRLLESLDSLVESGHIFQPATTFKTFKIGMSDLLASLILPKLIPIIEKEAPNMILNIVPMTQMYSAEPFKNEEYDIGIARSSSKLLPPIITRQLLLKDKPVCVLSPKHPLAKNEKITVDEYVAYKHVVWRTDNPEFPSVINQFLEKNGKKARDSILYLVYIDSFFRVIEASDNVIGSTFSIVELLFSGKYSCILKPFPLERMPDIETYIAWHKKFNDDLAHQWLRHKIIGIVEEILKNRTSPSV